MYWPDPELTYEPDPREGPVLVTVRYVAFAIEEPQGAHLFPADRANRPHPGGEIHF